jgi:leucyl-tRNA synthetase
MYELVNALAQPLASVAEGKADRDYVSAIREAAEILVHIIAPMTPHLAEECWKALGNDGLLADTAWPIYDEALVVENEITLPVQINGKKRADLTIARDADQTSIQQAVLALESVKAALDGKEPKKIIVVPQRIVNVVV